MTNDDRVYKPGAYWEVRPGLAGHVPVIFLEVRGLTADVVERNTSSGNWLVWKNATIRDFGANHVYVGNVADTVEAFLVALTEAVSSDPAPGAYYAENERWYSVIIEKRRDHVTFDGFVKRSTGWGDCTSLLRGAHGPYVGNVADAVEVFARWTNDFKATDPLGMGDRFRQITERAVDQLTPVWRLGDRFRQIILDPVWRILNDRAPHAGCSCVVCALPRGPGWGEEELERRIRTWGSEAERSLRALHTWSNGAQTVSDRTPR